MHKITKVKNLAKNLHYTCKDVTDDLFRDFPLLVPKSFAARIKPNAINDPLLLQILPQKCELKKQRGFGRDPLFERKYAPCQGLIHKYHGRVLLLVTNVCAINCRFCFRRYNQEQVTNWRKVFEYINNDPTISEVILSGGDPLMVETKKLQGIIDKLAEISHLKRIRIHTRVPIVLPQLVIKKTLRAKLPIIVVVHCNHPNEINSEVMQVLAWLRRQNLIVFNQTVLLKGINDNYQTLVALSEKLFNCGVIPYYLHILDKVQGAGHFYVGVRRAQKIYAEVQKLLPGYLVPKLVVEISGKKKYIAKTVL